MKHAQDDQNVMESWLFGTESFAVVQHKQMIFDEKSDVQTAKPLFWLLVEILQDEQHDGGSSTRTPLGDWTLKTILTLVIRD